ncbi:hypothetical protein EDC61_10522 [Sulfuritortus calidifontis]|uniref:Probable inorganic carbon transporter subunit DabA n=1 Tax=Sulfuritortus calidifontis TaxID=1914471 RepID=A0A4V2UQS9_9PROT|nr:DUF2309 domain-containing protein [Sulfuritortus calidifontis]TCS72368.1 hypothetical protein EDC61_10522 [Sulfuritortus calidifontis]
MSAAHHPSAKEPRTALRHLVEHLAHVLPAQAPIKDFVHHNTLHGFQHLPFRQALAEAARLIGARGYLPAEAFVEFYRQGRIDQTDLLAAFDSLPELAAEEVLLATPSGPITRRDVYLVVLLAGLRPLSASELAWRIDEERVLERFQADVDENSRRRLLAAADGAPEAQAIAELWRTCLSVLGIEHAVLHPEELMEPGAEKMQALLAKLPADIAAEAEGAWAERALKHESSRLLAQLFDRVGRDWTLRGLMLALTGRDLMDELRPYLLRHLAAHLDQGLAAWHNPARGLGFYTAWRTSAEKDLTWAFSDLQEWRQQLERLADDPLDTLVQELQLLGLDESRWAGYLEKLAQELPGWSGMFLWRHQNPNYAPAGGIPVDMLDYLAVRVVLERLFAQRLCRQHWRIETSLPVLRWYFRRHPAELLVRDALYHSRLPEYLEQIGHQLVRYATRREEEENDADWHDAAQLIWAWRQSAPVERPEAVSPCRTAWPLFRLAQHLGLAAPEIERLGRAGAERLLACVAALDEERTGYLWLNAYERHYREQIFAALAANHGRSPGRWDKRPEAQMIFCMDDREEGMRRHVEELNPAIETFGAAGFFGVAINWRGLDDETVTPLCPVVVTPAHEVREAVAPGEEALHAEHVRRRTQRLKYKEVLHQGSRRGLLGATVITAAAAPVTLPVLLAKVLLPARLGKWTQRLRERFDRQVPSRVAITAPADSPAATPAMPRLGFTDAEQAERVRNFLRTIGLTANFAPFVVLFGHGSHSQNNPHLSAYDCGACSGRHGGPNARVFAAMANRLEVRGLLAEQGIFIPNDTWFVGAEHNTCDDEILWYDEELVPPVMHNRFTELKALLAEAGKLHAQERCRRFASAPAGIAADRAWQHVADRAFDFSQARPELGHATNASAFIGRRAMSRGAFFDRRAFLISYDPSQDAEGKVLEAILLAAGPVGAGISLEYYFSTVNNERYGCGTKIVHNVTGLFGVMEGAASDLRTGLPRQMIEIHEAMRLLIVVEHTLEVLTAIYQRQPPLQELIGNGWVQLAAKDPDTGAIHLFTPQGWQPWQGEARLPRVARSADWFMGRREPLAPALIESVVEGGAP